MTSLGNPRTWIPYMSNRDCSLGFCSLYCRQRCYIIYPPPPPFGFPEDDDDSSSNFSPLVIAVIGILVSAFLLIGYYTLISKYCKNRDSSSRENHEAHGEMEESRSPSFHEPWHVPTAGLDEALIKSIAVCKYRKGDNLIEVTDCCVCLSEFEEEESVKLLPKCNHAFHVPCIDKWLKSHSNCPLCRAAVFSPLIPSEIQVADTVIEIPALRNENSAENENLPVIVERENEIGAAEEEEMVQRREIRKPASFRALSDLEGRRGVIEIRDEGYESMRRSFSMDHSVSVADILNINEEEDGEADSSKRFRGESSSKCSNKRRVLHCVLSPTAMKRSFPSGRFSFRRNGRVRQGIIPL